jgi:hypothetical protein
MAPRSGYFDPLSIFCRDRLTTEKPKLLRRSSGFRRAFSSSMGSCNLA